MRRLSIAISGNPNVGKTTLFNTLTGMRQHVGNWPGKTVEDKRGTLLFKGQRITLVDLPGTYSLTAYSEEEVVAREFVIEEKPEVVIDIVDATNLERNLYLTVQLVELGANVVVALNFSKQARQQGIRIDAKKLSGLLGVPFIICEANDRSDVLGLIGHALRAKAKPLRIRYGEEVEEHICQMEGLLRQAGARGYPARWLAMKLLEHDDAAIRMFKAGDGLLKEASSIRHHLETVFGEDIDAVMARARYGFIGGLLKEAVVHESAQAESITDRIDSIVTHKFLGIPIFIALMALVFQVTFALSPPLTALIERLLIVLKQVALSLMTSIGAPQVLISLVNDALIEGVGSVVVFVPSIFLLFLALAALEDSGYLARVAFLMDNIMHRIGLHGKSSIPLILGFGCTVPAIMATRSLDSKKDRLLTMLINPFMSCSARLPVYVLFVGAFFPTRQGLVILSLYLLGIVIAILMGAILNRTMFRKLSSPLVLELPPYRVPNPAGLLIHMWERGRSFITRAGTVIFSLVFVIWFLGNLPLGVEYASRESLIGRAGAFIAPVFSPLGFGTWQAAVALVFGFVAKEVVVGTMGTIYGVQGEGLGTVLQGVFTPLSAYSFMVFVLLYVPCIATIATIRRETNSWKWPLFAAAYSTAIAWLISFGFYQGARLIAGGLA